MKEGEVEWVTHFATTIAQQMTPEHGEAQKHARAWLDTVEKRRSTIES